MEEATKIALEDLNVNLEEVKIEVVSPGKSGILGLGGEPAIKMLVMMINQNLRKLLKANQKPWTRKSLKKTWLEN